MTLRTKVLPSLGATALALALLAGPAAATGNGNRGDHDGDADSSVETSYTEDTDHNDGGTPDDVADDGDNAHPSGRDRSVERGNGGNQGRSESDPDDDGHGPDRSNGGPDKPNGSGGVDAADQDGNNGCGNDDDFEDDNEGWCGHKPERSESKPEHEGPAATSVDRTKPGAVAPATGRKPVTAGPSTTTTVAATTETETDDTASGTETVVAPASIEDVVEGEVLGLELERVDVAAASTAAPASIELASTSSPASTGFAAVAAGALAFTGDHLLLLMTIAFVALAIGAVLVARSRRPVA